MLKYAIAAASIILVGYGCIKAFPLVAGPSLTITTPSAGELAPQDGIVRIVGQAERASELTLNGAPLPHDQNGAFSSTITVARGGSILTFAASDRFGRRVTETRELFVP